MTGTMQWLFYLCLTSVAASPYIRQRNLASNVDLGEYCSLMAVNKLIDSLQLPVIRPEISDHARYRAKQDNPITTDNVFLRSIMNGELTKLPGSSETLQTLNDQLTLGNLGEKQEQLKLEFGSLLNDIILLQDDCLRQIGRSVGNQNEGYSVEESDSFLQPQKSTDDVGGMDVNESPISEAVAYGSIRDLPKRNNLSLNPSGWRKRRSSMDRERRERVQHFLRNMRQLLDKRQQQRLNFNPTGW